MWHGCCNTWAHRYTLQQVCHTYVAHLLHPAYTCVHGAQVYTGYAQALRRLCVHHACAMQGVCQEHTLWGTF